MHHKILNNKQSNIYPIGVMDSGVGGVSVLRHIRAILPHESITYVADSLYAPYGNKKAELIIERCIKVADFLLGQQVKALVVACNTATAAAIKEMRTRYTVPIIGMEPAVKPAVQASKNGVIGVLATVGTLKSAQYAALLENYGSGVQVIAQGCEGLVECVESGALSDDATRSLLQKYLKPLLAGGADAIVLGCTHYPFLRPLITEIVGPEIAIIDTGKAVSEQLKKKLIEANLLADASERAGVVFWTNSQSSNAASVIQKLWGEGDVQIKRMV
ncbi:MAG TPA: glutamate racemase [Methylophilaceae bacterium]|nr:glutamate racemase [Methylophilaceae bacterium]